MSDQSAIEPASENATPPGDPASWRRRLRRYLSVLTIAVLVFALSAPLVLWLQYRQGNVVSHNAWVRGQVTYMGAPLDGVVADIRVDDGDHVQAGEPMARLWDLQLQARVRSAQAQLEQASRELEIERLAIAQERRRLTSLVARARAQRAAAKAEADDARERYEVLASLAGVGATSREDIREAEAAHRSSGAEWEAAQAVHSSAVVDYEGLRVREQGIAVFESRVATARAELAERQAALEKSVIRAPDHGRVVRRLAEPGTSLEVGDPVVSVWIGDRVWVEAWVDEADLADVKVGNAASVTVKPFPDRVFNGVVEAVGMAPDFAVPESDVPQPVHSRMRNSPVFLVRIAIDDPQGDLVPGLSAVVGISIAEPPSALPTSSTAMLIGPR